MYVYVYTYAYMCKMLQWTGAYPFTCRGAEWSVQGELKRTALSKRFFDRFPRAATLNRFSKQFSLRFLCFLGVLECFKVVWLFSSFFGHFEVSGSRFKCWRYAWEPLLVKGDLETTLSAQREAWEWGWGPKGLPGNHFGQSRGLGATSSFQSSSGRLCSPGLCDSCMFLKAKVAPHSRILWQVLALEAPKWCRSLDCAKG